MFSERSTAVEVSLHKRFIDDRDARCALSIALVKIAALYNRDFHIREVIGTSEESVNLTILARLRLIAFDFSAAARTAHEPILYLTNKGCCLHSRQSCDSFGQLTIKLLPLEPIVLPFFQRYRRDEDVFSAEAEACWSNLLEAAQHQAGANQQQQ